MVEGLSKTINGEKILDNLSFTLNRDDKLHLSVEMNLPKLFSSRS